MSTKKFCKLILLCFRQKTNKLVERNFFERHKNSFNQLRNRWDKQLKHVSDLLSFIATNKM